MIRVLKPAVLLAPILALLLLAAPALAGAPSHTSAFTPSDRDRSHGWGLLVSDEDGPFVVVHVPPRSSTGEALGSPGGSVREARRLRERPEAMAAWGNRLLLLFPPPEQGSARRIMSVAAVPGGYPGVWAYDPATRLRTLATIESAGEVAGFVGTRFGPAVLVYATEADERPGLLGLKVLDRLEWIDLDLPGPADRDAAEGEPPASFADALLVPGRDGLSLMVVGEDGRAGLWTGELARAQQNDEGDGQEADAAAPAGPPLTVGWSYTPMPGLGERLSGARVLTAMYTRGRLVLALQDDEGEGQLLHATHHGVRTVADLGPMPPIGASLFLPDVGRLVTVAAEQDGSRGQLRAAVREVSAWNGAEFYEGPAQTQGPISMQELRLLGIALVSLMVIVMVYVLSPDPLKGRVGIPPGSALAEPGRRVAAGMADLLLAALITSLVMDIPLGETLSIGALVSERGGHWGLLWTLLIGMGMCTLLEGFWGVSPGKLVLGVRVVRAGEPHGRPGLLRAAIRNACKWLAAPLALVTLLGPARRHRGDVLSATVVVIAAHNAPEQGG